MEHNLHPLRVWRLRQDLSLEALGRQVGVSGVTLSRIETWSARPSVRLSRRLQAATGVALFHLRPDVWPAPAPRKRGSVRS